MNKNIKFLKNLVHRSRVFHKRMEKLRIIKQEQMELEDLREYIFLLQQNKLAKILINHYENELDFHKEVLLDVINEYTKLDNSLVDEEFLLSQKEKIHKTREERREDAQINELINANLISVQEDPFSDQETVTKLEIEEKEAIKDLARRQARDHVLLHLTSSQKEIWKEVNKGKTATEISKKLGKSLPSISRTINNIKSQIEEKEAEIAG